MPECLDIHRRLISLPWYCEALAVAGHQTLCCLHPSVPADRPANSSREDADEPLRKYKTKFRWDVSARRDGEYFRVFYRHQYPIGGEETRDTRRFNTLAEAE